MPSFFKSRNRKAHLRSSLRRSTRRRIFESLERRQLLAGDVTIFADSFESGSSSNDWVGNWVEDSQNDWFRNTQRATDGNYSAEVDGRATDATLTMTNSVDLSGYDSATLTFDWLIETGFDSGEYLALDISLDGGASWNSDVLRLDGNSDPENTWFSETVDLTSFSSNDVLVRFRSKVSRSNEDANVDNVRIVGTESVLIDPAKPVKIFLLAGHSNVTGTGAAENLDPAWNVPQDDVLIWLDHDMDSDGNWVTLEPGHGWGTHAPRPDEPEGLDPRNGVGPELGLGRTLADAYPDHQVVLIKHGRGGGTIGSDWSPENVGPAESEDHMWSGLLQKTHDAFSSLDAAGPEYEVSGFFFALGAKDAANWNASSSDPAEVAAGEQEALLRSAEYGENLTIFIEAVRDEFSADLPFVMTRISDDIDPDLLNSYPGGEIVRQEQLDVVASVAGTVAFTGDGISLRDSVHYDAMGQIEFGSRFASAYLDLISAGSHNVPPVADAGVDQSFSDGDGTGGETATLNGGGSDQDGSVVSYEWTEGATVLANTASISPSLSVGAHTLTLTVTDNDGATASDDVIVTVVANQAPTANAGSDHTVADNDDNGSETITLVGGGTDTDGNIISYLWNDGASDIGTTASITPTLSVGSHTLTLTVTDNGGATSSESVTVTVDAAPSAGPNLTHGSQTSVDSNWQTVILPTSYTSMVVVATPRYNSNSGPGVVRINNANGNSFDVRVDDAGSSPFSGGVHYIVVEEGVYDEPGFKLEAVKYDEAETSRKNGWGIDTVGYQQSYSSPVVVGQVMTTNDEDFSVFWASSGSRTSPPTSSALNVGKHVAEDPDTNRATETVGYFVIEATQNGTIEGLPFVAGVGGDTVLGVGNGTYQYSYDAMPNAKTAVLSSAGMDGGDGGWAVLRGDDPVPATSGTISLSIDEDQLSDSERSHTTEQVAYFVIDPPVQQVARLEQAVRFSLPPIRTSRPSSQIDNADVDAVIAALKESRPGVIQSFAVTDTAVHSELAVAQHERRAKASSKVEDLALLDLMKLDSMD